MTSTELTSETTLELKSTLTGYSSSSELLSD